MLVAVAVVLKVVVLLGLEEMVEAVLELLLLLMQVLGLRIQEVVVVALVIMVQHKILLAVVVDQES